MGNEATAWPQHIAVNPWMRRCRVGVVNLAMAGATIAHIARRSQLVDSLAGIADENYVLLFELTNTLRASGGDVLGAYQAHRDYCEARRKLGFRVLIGTGLSRNQEAYYNQPTGFTYQQMCELNHLIRTTASEFADGVVDFAARPELGSEDAPLNKKWFWDGVHVTGLGQFLLIDVVLAALQSRIYQYHAPIIAASS